MAGSQNNYWRHHELNRVCFGLNADMNQNLKELQRQQTAKEFNSSFSVFFASDNFLLHHEGDQVVPSSRRRAQRESKPLPPPPSCPLEDLMSDEAADGEVEFFTSDRRRLLPRSCPEPPSGHGGRVNHAFRAAGSGNAFSWEEAAGRGRHQDPPGDKPRVPPRIPVRPKPADDDTPPKVPPRVPLVPPCPPRTPSPKCLPIYINGVMPATQSFAANPEYVSKALQQNQNQNQNQNQASPCIVPILKDGRQASATHYILLPPGRAPPAERRDRLMSEPARTGRSRQKR